MSLVFFLSNFQRNANNVEHFEKKNPVRRTKNNHFYQSFNVHNQSVTRISSSPLTHYFQLVPQQLGLKDQHYRVSAFLNESKKNEKANLSSSLFGDATSTCFG